MLEWEGQYPSSGEEEDQHKTVWVLPFKCLVHFHFD